MAKKFGLFRTLVISVTFTQTSKTFFLKMKNKYTIQFNSFRNESFTIKMYSKSSHQVTSRCHLINHEDEFADDISSIFSCKGYF